MNRVDNVCIYNKKGGLNPSTAGIKIELSILLRSAISGRIAVLFDIGHIFYDLLTNVHYIEK